MVYSITDQIHKKLIKHNASVVVTIAISINLSDHRKVSNLWKCCKQKSSQPEKNNTSSLDICL